MGLYHYIKCAIKYKLNVNIQRMREKTHFIHSEFSHPYSYMMMMLPIYTQHTQF